MLRISTPEIRSSTPGIRSTTPGIRSTLEWIFFNALPTKDFPHNSKKCFHDLLTRFKVVKKGVCECILGLVKTSWIRAGFQVSDKNKNLMNIVKKCSEK